MSRWRIIFESFCNFIQRENRIPKKESTNLIEIILYQWYVDQIYLSTKRKLNKRKEQMLRDVIENFKEKQDDEQRMNKILEFVSFMNVCGRNPRYFCDDPKERDLARWYHHQNRTGKALIRIINIDFDQRENDQRDD